MALRPPKLSLRVAAAGVLASMAVAGLILVASGIVGDSPVKVQEPVTVEGGDITKVDPLLVDLNGDGDVVDEAVEVKFYEAFYDADLNADGDETDGIIIAIDETVSVDLDGDGDTSVTVAFYEPFYGVDLNADGDEDDLSVTASFHEAKYSTDINRDGDSTDVITVDIDETVEVDLDGDGATTGTSIAPGFHEAKYSTDINRDGDSTDVITADIDESTAVLPSVSPVATVPPCGYSYMMYGLLRTGS